MPDISDIFVSELVPGAIPIWPVNAGGLSVFGEARGSFAAQWITESGFRAESGKLLLIPGGDGGLSGVLLGLGTAPDPFVFGACVEALPPGVYYLAEGDAFSADFGPRAGELAALGWGLGAYHFDRYVKPREVLWPRFVLPDGVNGVEIGAQVKAAHLVRDLINTPAVDMGPAELEEAARSLAESFSAQLKVVYSDDLLAQGYPLIHAVGRASDRPPRLLDLRWALDNEMAAAPRVTLVGKGVCFDSGGLNLKPGNSMALMKKDMGGAAHVLGLAQLIMEMRLPVRLRVLIPAVENSIGGNAFRPGDVLDSRKGLSVEIGNTDAEGRLVLADALAEADTESPDLLIDFATLTGAARTALGPDLPPYYCHSDVFADEVSACAVQEHDPLWRLPLWPRYDDWLKSPIADVNHVSDGAFAGSITAALFLNRFVEKSAEYVHLDIYGWNPDERPAHPKGGAAQGLRAIYALLKGRYGAAGDKE